MYAQRVALALTMWTETRLHTLAMLEAEARATGWFPMADRNQSLLRAAMEHGVSSSGARRDDSRSLDSSVPRERMATGDRTPTRDSLPDITAPSGSRSTTDDLVDEDSQSQSQSVRYTCLIQRMSPFSC